MSVPVGVASTAIICCVLGIALPNKILPNFFPAKSERVSQQVIVSAEKITKPVAAVKHATSQPAPAASPALQLPASISLRMDDGDTLLTVLTDTGVSFEEAQTAVQAIRRIYDPRRLDAGTRVAVTLNPSSTQPHFPTISHLSLPISKTAMLELKRSTGGAFDARRIDAPTEKHLVHLGGRINSSFYETAEKAGLSPEAIGDLVKVLSYDVDFQRDIQRGDTLDVLVERSQTKNGIVTGTGAVRYAALTFKHHTLSIYRYTDRSGNTDYYTEKGESLRKALLRTPINGARITSGFGMRMHPLLGYSKMHRGVDFGATTGTPIYAAGDGIIAFAGVSNGYGNYVRIRHNDKYETAYGHASRIASGIRPGARVRQGQVIAYVGSTGMATGPHLHYEVLMAGNQVNPAGIKFKTGNALGGKELAAFKSRVKEVQLAMGDSGKSIKMASAK